VNFDLAKKVCSAPKIPKRDVGIIRAVLEKSKWMERERIKLHSARVVFNIKRATNPVDLRRTELTISHSGVVATPTYRSLHCSLKTKGLNI